MVQSACAQGNIVPKRFLSPSRLFFDIFGAGRLGGAPGKPNPPGAGCIASYSAAGISRWIFNTLVAPKTSSPGCFGALPDGRLPPAPPCSLPPVAGAGVALTATSKQNSKQAPQVSAVAPARNRRLIATPHGFGFGVTAERSRGRLRMTG